MLLNIVDIIIKKIDSINITINHLIITITSSLIIPINSSLITTITSSLILTNICRSLAIKQSTPLRDYCRNLD